MYNVQRTSICPGEYVYVYHSLENCYITYYYIIIFFSIREYQRARDHVTRAIIFYYYTVQTCDVL